MLRNFAYGGLALIGGAITGIAISSWATPPAPPAVAPEIARVVTEPASSLALPTSHSDTETSNCDPWDVSDVAMEAALNEMIRRGWRPPNQADVLASFDSPAQAVSPQSTVPVRYAPSASPEPPEASVEPSAPFPVEPVQPTSGTIPSPANPPQLTAPNTSPPPPPAPAIVIGEPAVRN
ncbi:MAG TPA: hypothetical protein VFV70_07590 [Hyphomonadaceae bacterium]|nr:hypothetical protein [Hyphomonadaceae bacterium]